MKINRSFRRILHIAGWTLLLAGFAVLMIASSRHLKTARIQSEPIIHINYDIGYHFIDEGDIGEIISAQLTAPLSSYELHQLDLNRLESSIMNNVYVKAVEAYIDQHGNLMVDIIQREPVLRVINTAGVSYYLVKSKEKIPITPKFTSRVPVCSGFVTDNGSVTGEIASKQLEELYELATYIYEDAFWKAFVDQIFVNEEGQFELIPKIGHHTILFGEAEDLEEKFNKLYIFYRHGLRFTGADEYKMVDIRFKDQVVCKKR